MNPQKVFERYIVYADCLHLDIQCPDNGRGCLVSESEMAVFCDQLELVGKIDNPQDFRKEVITQAIQYLTQTNKPLPWTEIPKFKKLIEDYMKTKGNLNDAI